MLKQAEVVLVSTLTGLRVSELAGLRWNDIGEDSLTIDERYCGATGELQSPMLLIPQPQCEAR